MPNNIREMFDSLESSWHDLLNFLPQALIGAGLFVAAWFAARMIRIGLVHVFRIVRLESLSNKLGVESFLARGGSRHSTPEIAAYIVYWFLLFSVIMAILRGFGIRAATVLLDKFLSLIPAFIVAALVLVFGALFARLARRAALTYLRNTHMSGAEFISRLTYWTIIVLVFSVALEQLSAGQILITAFEIAFGGLCLALAIAFGLAGKERAAQIIEKLWRNTR